jgi:hypothetical protein
MILPNRWADLDDMEQAHLPVVSKMAVHYVAESYVFAQMLGLRAPRPFNRLDVWPTFPRWRVRDQHLATEASAESVNKSHDQTSLRARVLRSFFQVVVGRAELRVIKPQT